VSNGVGESASIPNILPPAEPPAAMVIDRLNAVVMEPVDTEGDLEDEELAEENVKEISSNVIAILEASHDP